MARPRKSATISIRIEPELKAELLTLARKDRRTLASFAAYVLAMHVRQRAAATAPPTMMQP